MAVLQTVRVQDEIRGGLESSIHGFATSIGPILIFASFFGVLSLPAALWAALVTATVVPLLGWALRAHPSLHFSSRSASLTAYAALILQLSFVGSGASGHGQMPTAQEFTAGLAAGSLLYAVASMLIFLAGLFGMGNIFKMIPSTVTAGISNSTAVLLVLLAGRQIWGNFWQGGVVAALMVIAYWTWTRWQMRSTWLRWIPNVLTAVAVGLVVNAWVVPMTEQRVASVGADLAWISLRLWPGLLDRDHLGFLLLQGLPGALTLALVMILESFTANHVMESRFGLRIQANRELIALGGANLVSALLGGVPGTASPIRCISNRLAGGRGARALWVAFLFTGLTILLLSQWLLVLPAGIIAGLFLLQAPLMIDPSFKSRLDDMLSKRQSHLEGSADLGFWITFVITLAGVFGNLVWACFMGIGLSCLAVLRRVSHSLTSEWTYLDQYRSRRVRSLSEVTVLEQAVHQVGVLQLTGHLFFGNSTRLTQLLDELNPEVCAVVVDVGQVNDVDPSGLGALSWLIRALVERELRVVLTGERHTPSVELRQVLSTLPGVSFSVDLDRGLEMCEEWVLERSAVAPAKLQWVPVSGNALLREFDDNDLRAVLSMLQPRQLTQGDVLFHRFDEADGIWLLEEGMVSILSGGGDASRLATFGPGQFVGEMGFVDGQSRSATATADTPLRAAFLSNDNLLKLSRSHPGAALKVTLNIARELSTRMRNSSAKLSDDASGDAAGWANSELLSTLSRY
jgi:MFS superfamily sulfate permease-like transporter